MKNWQKLVLVFIIAISALFCRFVLNNDNLARLIVTVAGSLLALSMFIEMIKTLRSGSYGVDILAITAIISTLAIGEYWASLIIILMLVGGESLEDFAANRASKELDLLISKTPVEAHLETKDGSLKDIKVIDVQIGDKLVVRPLELVPVDAKLISQTATIDQSSLTGESKPVEMAKGTEILSGSINGDFPITIEAIRLAKDSKFQQIVSLVEEIKSTPAQFVRLADRYAVPFTIIAYLIAGTAWFISKDAHRFAEVLVVASPCPLILAAPIAFVAGMSRLSKNNILVKNGSIIEKLADVKTAFFDKTGTLTQGNMRVEEIIPASDSNYNQNELLSLAASIEQSSNHILAKAIVSKAKEEKISFGQVQEIKEVPGQGIVAQLNGKSYNLGRDTFAHTEDNQTGTTNVYISEDGKYIGKITLSDQLRPDAKEVISELENDLQIKNVIMLTGDDKSVASNVANELGIKQYYSNLLPEEKLDKIKSVPKDDKPTLMVGDGINDALALAYADVGISIGSEGVSTVASESADVVILKNDLSSLVTSIKISRDTLKTARESVWIGIFICVILMLIASTGVIPAIVGALLQEVVDTVSILYALKALRDK
ncbi:heavy metal translocating P-type ATPase [Floricoccus penangensis]|uniref:heavy metal translocating P-type ATPase n=1 Tax=Floricoccus penangensis TaxID=1859475 RepID=UPI00203C4E70|nr:heavy metal translocating P-type ATPase [Floricoccus penangensis]URZ86523.1 cadmium-translocating P-type ATPase [Floricoccus penangensis]